MRWTAAVLLLLLTATAAQAGISGTDLFINPLTCCSALLFFSSLAFVIALAIHDWRKARRPRADPRE